MYYSDNKSTSAVRPLLLNNRSTSTSDCKIYIEEVYGTHYDTVGNLCFIGTKTGNHKYIINRENGQ